MLGGKCRGRAADHRRGAAGIPRDRKRLRKRHAGTRDAELGRRQDDRRFSSETDAGEVHPVQSTSSAISSTASTRPSTTTTNSMSHISSTRQPAESQLDFFEGGPAAREVRKSTPAPSSSRDHPSSVHGGLGSTDGASTCLPRSTRSAPRRACGRLRASRVSLPLPRGRRRRSEDARRFRSNAGRSRRAPARTPCSERPGRPAAGREISRLEEVTSRHPSLAGSARCCGGGRRAGSARRRRMPRPGAQSSRSHHGVRAWLRDNQKPPPLVSLSADRDPLQRRSWRSITRSMRWQ